MTALEPTLVERWTRRRALIVVVATMVLGAIVVAIAQSQQSRGFLDPEGVDATGARALVRILEAQGVTVTPARTIGDVADSTTAADTVLVTVPDLLASEQIAQLRQSGADLVLIAPDATAGDFASRVAVADSLSAENAEPECGLPAADLAGSARMGGLSYDAPKSAEACYPVDDAPTLVVTTSGDSSVTFIGTGDPLTNRYLDKDGNAALAMNLLGSGDGLTWYRPTLEPGAGGDTSITSLFPDWVAPVTWELVIAAALAAWWRMRRFGPLAREPLPVIVHAAEVTEGRAGLYRQGRARGHAAQGLREATTDRLRIRLGMPPGVPVEAVADAVAEQGGRRTEEIGDLLSGDAPVDDASLVRLANDLADLEAHVSRP